MTESYQSKVSAIDPESMRVDFSPEVRSAFRDMAAALHFSDKVSPEMLSIMQEWADSAKPGVQSVLVAFPALAQAVFASGNRKAKDAWKELGRAMLDHGFSLQTRRGKSSERG